MNNEFINRNKNINRGYRKLEIWQQAIELFAKVKNKIDRLHNISMKVKGQIEDSALSVSSNIAEGYSSRSIKENIKYINYSLASLSENYSQIFALLNAQQLEDEWFEEYDKEHYSLENKLINFNKSMVNKIRNHSNWKDDYILREIIEKYNEE
jgi:four helix bundle protein